MSIVRQEQFSKCWIQTNLQSSSTAKIIITAKLNKLFFALAINSSIGAKYKYSSKHCNQLSRSLSQIEH